jgi:glutathione S-transferase
MDFYFNLTSPYARIVRVALHEKGLIGQIDGHVVDPWANDPKLVAVNPISRVPTLVTDEGEVLTESLLIVLYLEQLRPEPALVPGAQSASVLARAGTAIGALDACVHILIGRKVSGAAFDDSPVGQRRRKGIHDSFARLEDNPPGAVGTIATLDAIAVATLIDYAYFRFPETAWLKDCPRLRDWREGVREHGSLMETMPQG